MATERISTYQREAAQDRQSRFAAVRPGRSQAPVATASSPATSSRRALAAAFVGLAAIGAMRWRR